MKCSKCGRIIEKNKCLGGMCQACYYYFKNGGTENELPSKGVIKYDERGCVICHICGRAYKRLGSHVKESHNMTIFEYKEQFGLCNNARTTEENYSKNMSKLAYKYDMHKSLPKWGYDKRIKQGETGKRKGKKSRLQECLERAERYKKK